MGLIKKGTLPSDSMSCSKDAAVNDGGFLKLQDEMFISGLQHRIETLIGRISWNAQGEQQIETFMSQYFRGKFHAVAPEELQTGNISLVYPMPTWDERIFNPTFGHWTEIFITVLSAVFIVASVFWAIFMYSTFAFCNNHVSKMWSVFKAASPAFMTLILIGSIILYCSVFTFLPNVVTRATCIARAWVLDLGFILLFGPFFAKTLRIERLWKTMTTEIIQISNLQVLSWVLVLVGVHVTTLIVMTIAGNPRVELVEADIHRVVNNYYECRYNTLYTVLSYCIVVVNGLLLLIGAVIAFRVRNIPIKRYNESKIIFFSVYNVIFFSIITLGLFTPEMDRFIKFFLTMLFVMLGAALTVNTLFIVKLHPLSRQPTTTTGTTSSAKSGTGIATGTTLNTSKSTISMGKITSADD